MLYFAVQMVIYMLLLFPRNFKLCSDTWNDKPIPLWPEDYDQVTATLMHIGTENRFQYLNRSIRKGGGSWKNGGLAGYLDAIPKSFRISATPKKLQPAIYVEWSCFLEVECRLLRVMPHHDSTTKFDLSYPIEACFYTSPSR